MHACMHVCTYVCMYLPVYVCLSVCLCLMHYMPKKDLSAGIIRQTISRYVTCETKRLVNFTMMFCPTPSRHPAPLQNRKPFRIIRRPRGTRLYIKYTPKRPKLVRTIEGPMSKLADYSTQYTQKTKRPQSKKQVAASSREARSSGSHSPGASDLH